MKTKKIYVSIALVVAILIIVNLLSDQFSMRLDFTEGKQYTLSQATRDILKNLKSPVTVKAYFSENLPPDVAKTRKDFKELLIEYASISNNMVVYEFINPGQSEEKEKEAMQSGIQPVLINVRDKDQMKQQKAFLGALVQMGDQKKEIPFMQPGAAMEYALSTAIKKTSLTNKPAIALLQGHGEPDLNEMQQVNDGLNVLYQYETLTLTDSTPIPDRFKTITIIAPKDSFPRSHLAKLDEFLNKGGNLFIGINRVHGDLSTGQGSTVNTGLEDWLKSKGIEIDDNFLIDTKCGSVMVQQQQGQFRFNNNISFPYIPIINHFANHPVTKGLENVVLQFVSAIRYTGDSSKTFTPIAFSSEKSGSLKSPLYFEVQRQWNQNDFQQKSQVVAAVITGKLSGNTRSRMVVVGDGDFAINGERKQAQNLQPDNINLMVNSVDWLSDDTGLIELRTKGVTSRPLNQIEDGTKTMLKYLNFLLPLLLIIIYGFIRMQIKRNIRIKRMEENYA